MVHWERQKSEIYSYNIFNSAIKRRHDTRGLHSFDYNLVGLFLHIHDGRNEVVVEPDFMLYHTTGVLLIEIKSGDNINPRDIDQMGRYNDLDREAVENFLQNKTDIAEQGLKPRKFETVDHCVIYSEDFIQKCKDEWENCRARLEELKEISPVLTQKRGAQLQLEAGSLNNSHLESILMDGVDIPHATDKTIYLTENVELECISYSICNDIVLNNLQADRFTLSPSDVRNFYGNRQIPMHKLKRSFEFLEHLGACTRQSDGSFAFNYHNISEIMSVEEKLREKSVEEHLDDSDEDQSDWDDWM